MPILDQKVEIFSKLSALKTLNSSNLTGYKSKLTNSLPSVNNGNSVMSFLMDLLKVTRGMENIVNDISKILSQELPKIEVKIKQGLKDELKSSISCQINPHLPDYIKSTSSGINVKVSNADFFDILHTNPTSSVGNLIYNDVNSGANSKDFNTFLYNTLQSDNSTQTWGLSTVNKQIMDFSFISSGSTNNTLNIKANSSYDNLTLTQFNNDFIDSVNLFYPASIMNKVTDLLYGTLASSIGKNKQQLVKEQQINDILTKFINAEDDDTIDDSYFQFSNDQVREQLENSINRSNGIRKLVSCGQYEASIPFNVLSGATIPIQSATTIVDINTGTNKALNTLANQSASNASTTDQNNVKLDFHVSFLQNLIQALISEILTPKLLILFILNDKIVNGQNSTISDPVTFLKTHKSLMKAISSTVSTTIQNYITKICIQEIQKLVAQEIEKKAVDMGKNASVQMLSLFGVSSTVLRKIKGL